MNSVGHVTLNNEIIGSFDLDGDEKITITFDKGAAGVKDTLEFAAERGMGVGLLLMPSLNDETPSDGTC